ncbi:MAG: prepilin-type N-terminal cleavage/methylation domain-containing protein [Candidatus Delongbacteria bacterium]|jgi:prepilin-type N-terminal cleavage/methylation domain-containing protein|nr:prepilin-type N-terminal cleavage/methylation domain-containing protein [Candidatus Delongbacteria bacterium]MDD4206282.1 prepilin-type N-terminal cleavage/methylation domain-containing protein [Candidatus Delongbacteria bacterium]MDY0017212.1 prepilin-type N-terminal cleavage/methylation domain-containing protein [Candidatus Delongbacteria bacterium]
MKDRFRKGFSLIELITVTSIIAVLASVAVISYRIYIKTAVVSALKSAVMVNVQLIQAQYDINGYWVTDDPENENLTTPEELEAAGLVTRNWSGEFIMRVFKKEGFPHVIAREEIGKQKYMIEVDYHFKTRELRVTDLEEED